MKSYKAIYKYDTATKLFGGQNTEIKAAVSQGSTIEELRSNLVEATKLCLEVDEDFSDVEIQLIKEVS